MAHSFGPWEIGTGNLEDIMANDREQDRERTRDAGKDRRPDYGRRKRSAEWRENWFYQIREKNDVTYMAIVREALVEKQRLIKDQIGWADSITAYAPAGAGTPWVSVGPRNINGRVKSIAVHPTNPDILYVGAASGGVWKSTDGGQSWDPLWNDQSVLVIGSIALAPSDPDTIYAGTGEWTPGYITTGPGDGLFVSTDGGASWTQQTGLGATRVARVAVSPTDANRVYVAGNNGFEYSDDGGATWTTLMAGDISDAVIDPSDADKIYIAVDSDAVYQTTDNGATWTRLAAGPTGGNADWLKLSMGLSGTHGTDFLLAKGASDVWKTTDGGATWSTLGGTHNYAWHGWCDLVAVAPDDEDIIVVGGSFARRTTDGGASWSTMSNLHADHHMAVFAPSDTDIVYEANDGGLFNSTDKGANWSKASHGLVITQFYDVGSWSHIGTVCGGGTQDQGTNMTTGGLTWENIFGWDGGYLVIHPTDPRTIYAEHQGTDIHKSIDGGDNWIQKTSGITGSDPWTGVITMDLNNPDTLFTGTQRVFRTTDGCATPWTVSSQDVSGSVTSIAVSESDPDRVYAASSGGTLLRSDDGGATNPWLDKSAGLPTRTFTDVVVDHADENRVAVCLGGTSATGEHVFLSTDGGESWTDISGNLPNLSANAFAFDPGAPDTSYVGTDVGVYRTQDGGTSWHAFDNGLPNVIVADLTVDRTGTLLIAATFGRGMYKVPIGGGVSPSVDLYLRDSVLDTGERFPSPNNEPHPNDVSDTVHWWESPDIKVDTAPFYVQDLVFDGVEFDELTHEDPRRTETNRFYLQVHNRGWEETTDVRVRAFLADASAGLPSLPNPLTPPDFDLTSTADWTPIGPAQTIPVLEPNRPVIVSWDFDVPAGSATHSCLLAVVSSSDDPITTTETNVNQLVKNEKRVCLKNLHVVDGGPRPQLTGVTIAFNNALLTADLIDIIIRPDEMSQGTVGLLLEPVQFADAGAALHGVTIYSLREGEDIGSLYHRYDEVGKGDLGQVLEGLDTTRLFEFDPAKTSVLRGIKMAAGQKLKGLLTLNSGKGRGYGRTQRVVVMQAQGGDVVGGSTYELRARRAKDLSPVSRIRVVLEKIRILDDHDPWFKGAGEFRFHTSVAFNNDPCRAVEKRLPHRGAFKISDVAGRNELALDACVFDGYVAESDRMTVSIVPVEQDLFDPDDVLPRYRRSFEAPPEAWVGRYRPGDEAADPETASDWQVWYRIESVKL